MDRVEDTENKSEINGMYFGSYRFDPQEDITLEDVVELLRALDINLTNLAFDRVPEKVRRHFIKFNRYGDAERYRRQRRR